MTADFLEAVHRAHGRGSAAMVESGKAGSVGGSGLPSGSRGNFMFATGIECSAPTIQGGRVRRDQLEECGHYARWREDLALVRDLGLKVLRYGLPYHRTHLGPGQYDFSFADDVLTEMRRLGITPILDLLHFGVPDWIGNFQNPDLPVLFGEYAGAVARRYPWVRYYTPVNEIYITARASTLDGIWNEQACSDQAFVTAMKHLVAASILGTQGIVRTRSNAVIVQSESAEYLHDLRAVQGADVRLVNKLRFLSLDLLYGHPVDSDVTMYLMDNGLTRPQYEWFMAGEPPGYQIMGNDYYGRNERILKPDGTTCIGEDVLGWYQITKKYFDRYQKPVMHTETNTFDPDYAPTWLWKQWTNVLQMRADGVPVLGFTWYSLTDQVDWDSGLAEQRGTVNACGLYDLDRRPRPVAFAYQQLLEEFGRLTIVPHGDLFETTQAPALSRTEV